MTSPESPAVQDTDRLREVADALITPEMVGAFFDEHHSAGIDVAAGLTGWPRETAQIRAGLIAVLAAVLPVHREMVGREIFNALSEEIAWQREKYGDGTDRAAVGRLIGMEDAATTVRRLAVSAPPTPPGSPPADERATAVETGRAVDDGGYEPFVADEHFTEAPSVITASWMEVSWAEASAIAAEELRQMEARRVAADRDAAAVPGTGGDLEWQRLTDDLDDAMRGRSHLAEECARLRAERNEARAECDRLALDLQARDIAVREADRLREQVGAERDRLADQLETMTEESAYRAARLATAREIADAANQPGALPAASWRAAMDIIDEIGGDPW